MKTASAITQRLKASGLKRRSPGAIYAVAMDDHNVHCFDESMLDAWWASLDPERKAEIFEMDLEGDGYSAISLMVPVTPAVIQQATETLSRFQQLTRAPFTPVTREVIDAAL